VGQGGCAWRGGSARDGCSKGGWAEWTLPLHLCSCARRLLSQDTLNFFEKDVRNTTQLVSKGTGDISQMSVAGVKCVGGTPTHKTPPQLFKRPKTEEALGLAHGPPYREHLYRPVPCADQMVLSSHSLCCLYIYQ